jgi:hypothetical protein
MYRINGWDDLYSTGYFDYLDEGASLIIEWSENIEAVLPEDCVRVTINKTNDENERIIEISGVENIENRGDVFVREIVHPNSGFVFNEKHIPLFFETKNKIIEMMNSVSFLKFVAMDVAITENGFKIIETNSYPAPDIAQYNYGFKVDPNFDYFWANDKNN